MYIPNAEYPTILPYQASIHLLIHSSPNDGIVSLNTGVESDTDLKTSYLLLESLGTVMEIHVIMEIYVTIHTVI